MKSQRSMLGEENRNSRVVHYSRAMNASSSTANPPSTSNPKKHSFGLGRFSLRRFFNPSSFSRAVNGKHRTSSQLTYKDSQSENGSTCDNKVSILKAYIKISSCALLLLHWDLETGLQ